jgi:hypothetical protein
MPSLSPAILSVIAPFALLFSCPVWNNAITLFIGAILCRGKRTVCAALRVMGLSHETNLEPSAKSDKIANRRHKTTLQWTIQMIIQVGRWLKYTPITLVGDGGFACGELAWLCLKLKIGLITRLKMNARVYVYTMVCLICNRLQEERPIEVAQTAWYEKKDATFSDLLKAVRKVLWKDNLIFRKHIFEPFLGNNKGLDEVIGIGGDKIPLEISWIGVLIEHLSAA